MYSGLVKVLGQTFAINEFLCVQYERQMYLEFIYNYTCIIYKLSLKLFRFKNYKTFILRHNDGFPQQIQVSND